MADNNYGFWTFAGKCALKGAPSTVVELADGRVVTQKDADNPAVLTDVQIAHMLRTSRQARTDFTRLFPDLDEESQERLSELILMNPKMTSLLGDPQDFFDAIQTKAVSAGVRTRILRRFGKS